LERWGESAVLFVMLIFAIRIGFGGELVSMQPVRPVGLVIVLPFVVWAAFRFGPREAATAVLLVTGFGVWERAHTLGMVTGLEANELLLRLQIFIVVIAGTSLAMAAM